MEDSPTSDYTATAQLQKHFWYKSHWQKEGKYFSLLSPQNDWKK